MEGYLRLILLTAAAIVVVFIVVESWVSRRRQFKLSNLSSNYTPADPSANAEEDNYYAQDVNENESQDLNPGDVEDYYLTEAAPPIAEKNWHVETFPEDGEEVVVEARIVSRMDAPVETHAATTKPTTREAAPDYANDLLVLSVVAKPGLKFGSYDLLQAIYATGLEFGDMNIFHYFSGDSLTREKLFSLASATEPGEFDLDRIGNYTCSGLTLFTVLSTVSDPQKAFDAMLKAAEQLAEDLNGQLCAGPRRAWNQDTYHEYQQKVLYFLLKQRA